MTLRLPHQILFCGLALTLVLAGCSETELVIHTAKESSRIEQTRGYYKVGEPYQIAGIWYYPKQDFEYDETGIASWYGPGFHGNDTANGEKYDELSLTAAHRTLPMPSVVRVTNLENGRAIKLRVNDRGPFKKGRIIDVSRKAARLLGFERKGTAKVRVEILAPESRRAGLELQQDEAAANAPPAVPLGTVTAQALPAPGQDAASAPSEPSVVGAATGTQIAARSAPQSLDQTVTRKPVSHSDIFVQVGAFAQKHNALRMKARVAALGDAQIIEQRLGNARLYRVHVGPLRTVEQADQMVHRLEANGIKDVQLIVR